MRKIRKLICTFFFPVAIALIGAYCGLGPNGAYLEVDPMRCTGCAECTSVCPVDAARIIGGKAVIDPTKCITCGRCVEICPMNAIQ